MMDSETKMAIRVRPRRIVSQVNAVERMVEADCYCIELMHQLYAVPAAIGKAAEVVLRFHVQTSGSDTIRSGDEREYARKS